MNRIALAQITSSSEKKLNLKLANDLISEAKTEDAHIIVFPEFLMAFSPSSQSSEELAQLAETINGPFATSLMLVHRSKGGPLMQRKNFNAEDF